VALAITLALEELTDLIQYFPLLLLPVAGVADQEVRQLLLGMVATVALVVVLARVT
jgi:hypothetical protein